MFSFSSKGVTSGVLENEISLEKLVDIIRDHPQKQCIQYLHQLEYGSENYKQLKIKFPYVTPHGTFNGGRKKQSFVDFSGVLYYDIDCPAIHQDIDTVKSSILSKHRDKICLLGRSVGNRGLFIYLRLENPEVLTIDNFDEIHEYVRTVILKDISTDRGAKGLARTHIIPYDPELYYNSIASLKIQLEQAAPKSIKSLITSINKTSNTGYRVNETFLPITEVLKSITTRTKIDLQGKDILIADLPYCDIFIPRFIKDEQKHKIFTAIVNGLILNNPGIELLYILSFINFINQTRTGGHPMSKRELERTVRCEFERITAGGLLKVKTKRYHTSINLGKTERIALVAQYRAKEAKAKSKESIRQAISNLRISGEKLTQEKVHEKLKGQLSLSTIKRHWRKIVIKNYCKNFKLGIRGIKKTTIEGYDAFEVMENGEIYDQRNYCEEWNHFNNICERIDRGGYRTCRLSKNGQTRTFFVHRLVALHFVPNPYNLPFVNHKNGNKMDCSSKNLEWCTHSHNVRHAYKNGLIRKRNKKVLNTFTGEVYESVKIAAASCSYKYSSLKNALNGNRKNQTGLEYME
jgi:hypothetical protein